MSAVTGSLEAGGRLVEQGGMRAVEIIVVKVERDASKAKFWLEPIALQSSTGFSRADLNAIYRLIEQNHPLLLQHWHDYFDS